MKNSEKKDLAAYLLQQLKKLRADLTVEDVCKIASTFYLDALRLKKNKLT